MQRVHRVRRWWALRRPAGDDEGFSLVEVLVAIVLFALTAGACLTGLNLAISTTRADRDRVAAANLASRELEIVRNQFNSATQGPSTIVTNEVVNPDPLPGGTAGAAQVVDNVKYTVTRTAQWTASGAGAAVSPCDNGASDELTSLKVRVEVTWDNMGSVQPVADDTLLTPRKGTYDSSTGHIGIKVLDANGVGVGGHTVTVTGPSGTFSGQSADDGCTIFAFLKPGSYTASVSDPGYVDRQGNTTPTQIATVTTGQMWKGSFDYDLAAQINATFVPPNGYALPTGNDLTLELGNNGLTPFGSVARPGSGSTRTALNLWPYPSGYALWAGDCVDSDPASTGQARANPVPVTAGQSTTATVDLAGLTVNARQLLFLSYFPMQNATIVAVHASDSQCSSGDTEVLGRTDGNGQLKTSLPYGTWQIQIQGRSPVGGWPSVTLQRGGGNGSTTVTGF